MERTIKNYGGKKHNGDFCFIWKSEKWKHKPLQETFQSDTHLKNNRGPEFIVAVGNAEQSFADGIWLIVAI